VIVALTGGQKLALLVAAGVFIAFALASSFLFPRTNPDFPGRRLRLFIAVTAALLVAMLTAMAVFAREDEEETEARAGEVAQEEDNPEPETTPAPETEPEVGGGPQEGDAQAGKQVFASAGCGACHALADAGSSGQIGPNLDEAKPDYALVHERVTEGKGAMPSFSDRLSEAEIRNVAAYVAEAAGGAGEGG
jgi:mono/diheme cytochrome c family protein